MIDAVIDSASLRRRDRIYPALRAFALAVEGDDVRARAAIDELLAEGLDSICDFSNGLATLAVLVEAAARSATARWPTRSPSTSRRSPVSRSCRRWP